MLPGLLLLDLGCLLLVPHFPNVVVASVPLFLLTALVAVRLSDAALIVQLSAMGVGLAAWLLTGAPADQLLLVAAGLGGIVAVLRYQHVMVREQVFQTDHLRRLMELLPVLKARGVEDVVQAAVRHIVKATGSELGVVLLLDEQAQVLRAHHIYCSQELSPEEGQAMMAATIEVGAGLTGWAAQHGESVFTNDAVNDPRSLLVPGTTLEDESIMVVPLMTNGRLYGVLRLDRKGKNQYAQRDLHLLELMAAHVSDAISRAQLEERMARRDALTGVYNRHFLNEWSHRMASMNTEVSLLMIDCRGFKQINDRWGHLTGDWVLQQCAALISESVRARDLVVRYGGDEFLVVLDDTSYQSALAIAERVQQRVAQWNAKRREDEPRLVLDIGVDTALQGDWQKLMDRADERMYACKHA